MSRVGSRNFSQLQVGPVSTEPSKRNWDPKKIYPTEPGKVRVTGITLRDGHQSLNGGMHRIEMLEEAAQLIDKIRPVGMEYPGQEEIGGGTTVDFPLRFKGENPFRNMERISRHLPNTPTSCLIRSDSLCGYNINPRDVVKGFITRYAECGLDIFRNFDAYNNVSNHATVSEAVIEAGKHYQACLTFTSHEDPTLFNVKWVADLCKDFERMGAHSFCIKDMAGIASPALMKAWVAEMKDACPDIPIIVHSHYTTGFAPITYLQAVEAGASGVDCGISTLSGRSGHPSMEVFNQVLADLGYDLGWDPKDADAKMAAVAKHYREEHPKYEFCEMKMAGAVDYRVFQQGIPGGQISVLRNELVRQGYGHLFDNVIDQIQRVRTQVGGVALVTPTSEHVARQSIVNAMNGLDHTTDTVPFWPGYSEMLRGTMGRPPMRPQESLQKRALREWTEGIVKGMSLEDSATEQINAKLPGMIDFLWELSHPIRDIRDAADLQRRVDELTELDAQRFAAQIKESQTELAELNQHIQKNPKDVDERYTNMLARKPDDARYKELLAGTGLGEFVNNGTLTREQFLDIVVAGAFCTVCPSSILPANGLEKAMEELEQLAVDKEWEYLPARGSIEFKEWAILHVMFKHAQNIALNWFMHHRTNPQFWDNKWPSDFDFGREEVAAPVKSPSMYPYMSRSWTAGDNLEVKWSETEVRRVMGADLAKLKNVKAHLAELAKYTPENENRKILKDRDVERSEKLEAQLTKSMREKLKVALYAIKSHESGYHIDIEKSINENFATVEKLMA